MGIKDFHKHTKHYMEEVHVSKYKRVACDASAWLHSGASPFALEIHEKNVTWAENEKPWVAYPMKMVAMLRSAGVEPVVSFSALFCEKSNFGLIFVQTNCLFFFASPLCSLSSMDAETLQRSLPAKNAKKKNKKPWLATKLQRQTKMMRTPKKLSPRPSRSPLR